MTEEKSLPEEFRESAAALQKAFPDELDRLVLLVDTLKNAVFISQDIADRLSGNTHAVREALDHAFPKNKTNIGRAEYNYSMAGLFVNLIAMKEDIPGFYSPRYTKEMAAIANFDHEMGHLVVENGLGLTEHIGECAAGAYAALRHIQRFGKKTDFFEYSSKADLIILGVSSAHYTDAAIQRVREISEERDISDLSLQKTAELAAEIALKCQKNEETLKKISDAFLPAQEAYKSAQTPETICMKVISIMKKNIDDADIFEAGKRFLSFPPRKKFMSDSAVIPSLAITIPYWKEALDLINQPAPAKKGVGVKRPSSLSPA